MRYDFETWTDRTPQGSEKWLAMHKLKPDVASDIVPLSVADMEFVLAPEIRDGLKEYLDTVVLGYTAPTPAYREAVQTWLARMQDLTIEKDWIVVTPGVVPAIGLAIRACTQPGDGIILMTPVYYPFYLECDITKREKLELELTNTGGRYTIDFDALERLAADEKAKVLLLCSPHNPVSRVWTPDELAKMGEICERHHLYVISDEIHGDLIMPGYRHMPFMKACPNLADRTFLLTAPSKTFNLAGMQGSSAIIPDPVLREAYEKGRLNAGMGDLNTLSYLATEIAYTRTDGWYRQMLQTIDSNRKLCEEFIREEIPEAVVTPLEGTYLLWVDLRYLGLDPKELENRMIAHDLFFDEGYIFGQGGAGFERINLAAPASVLRSAMLRLRDAVQADAK